MKKIILIIFALLVCCGAALADDYYDGRSPEDQFIDYCCHGHCTGVRYEKSAGTNTHIAIYKFEDNETETYPEFHNNYKGEFTLKYYTEDDEWPEHCTWYTCSCGTEWKSTANEWLGSDCEFDEIVIKYDEKGHWNFGRCKVCGARSEWYHTGHNLKTVLLPIETATRKCHVYKTYCTGCDYSYTIEEVHDYYDDPVMVDHSDYSHILRYTCKICGYQRDVEKHHTDDYCVKTSEFGNYKNLGDWHAVYTRCPDCHEQHIFKYKHTYDMTTKRYVCDHINHDCYVEAYCPGCNSWHKIEDVEEFEYTSEDYYTYINQTYCDRITTTRCYHCNYIKTTRSHYAHVVVTNSLTGETFCKNCGHEIAKDRAYEPPEDEPLIQHEHTFRHVEHIAANEWHNGYDLNRCECGEEDKYYMTEESRLYNPELDGKTFTDCVKYLIKIRQPKNSEELNDVFAEARTYFDL